LPRTAPLVLTPRKSPVQARSAASVDAILEATLQVLLAIGKERLTTTAVAHRAGVSVGTLYQYFPNKSSLLQAALKRHLDSVTLAVERICEEQKGHALEDMATALITTFLQAKMKDGKTSAALYSVSSDVDGARIAQQMQTRCNKAVVAMLKTSSDPLTTDPQLVAAMLQGAMVGVSRRLLESPAPEKHFPALLHELLFLARTYMAACTLRA
jgi:AcrR family transcriptional regulator